jgi:hypothetical protein
MVTTASIPVIEWHTEQNKTLRSIEGSRGWLLAQIGGKFMAHVAAIVGQLVDPNILQRCLFAAPCDVHNEEFEYSTLFEDDFADIFMVYTLGLATHRVRRVLWLMHGWPTRMLLALESEARAVEVMEEFRVDLEVSMAVEASPRGTTLGLMHARSPFQMTAVAQLEAAMKELNFQNHPDFQALLAKRAAGVIATQAVEDCIGTSKNAKQSKQSSRFRRPERAMAVCLGKNILSERHHFTELKFDAPLQTRADRLPPEAVRATAKDRSMDLHAIQGTASSPPWWSPQSQHNTVPQADLVVLRAAHALKDLALVENTWMGKLLDLDHRTAIKVCGRELT